jgi:hypothetical protein
MRKQHLDAFATLPRPLEGRRAPQGARDLAGMLIDAARNPTSRRIGTAALLQPTGTTVKGAAQIKSVRALIHNPALRGTSMDHRYTNPVDPLVVKTGSRAQTSVTA